MEVFTKIREYPDGSSVWEERDFFYFCREGQHPNDFAVEEIRGGWKFIRLEEADQRNSVD